MRKEPQKNWISNLRKGALGPLCTLYLPPTTSRFMKTIQFREAVCEAMTEEMRRDENIFLMGEEVAE